LPQFTGLLIGAALLQNAGAAQDCTQLLQAQDARAVPACKAQFETAENAPGTERMARIVAGDNYGVALLAVGHQPQQSLEAFNRAIALLPESTVKPDSLQWAVPYWHRGTAYQQLAQWDRAAADLQTAEATFTRAISASAGDAGRQEHFRQFRQRVRQQRADVLEHAGRHSEAQKLRATQ
jgi:tetratricopeptide (TPR) repeat protein